VVGYWRTDERFVYDPEIGRFTPRNALGPAAETLDALHDAEAKMASDEIAKKIESGDPNDVIDAAEGIGQVFAKMAEGALAPKKLIPTHAQRVEDAKPPRSPTRSVCSPSTTPRTARPGTRS
jgi:hypothetical protein